MKTALLDSRPARLIAAAVAALMLATAFTVSSATPSSAAYKYTTQLHGVNIYACLSGSTTVKLKGVARKTVSGHSYLMGGRSSSIGYYSRTSGTPMRYGNTRYLNVYSPSSDRYVNVYINMYEGRAGAVVYGSIYKPALPRC